MKVILLKDVPKLGQRFEVKEVKSGHALNFLIPNGDAMPATKAALNQAEVLKAKAEGERKLREDLISKNLSDLEAVILRITEKVNDKGHLFAGLHREVIVSELEKQTGLQISPEFIQLEHPIKEAGEHVISVKAGNKTAKLKIVITAV